MIFPDSPRVVYASNPLAEVICQLKFPQQFVIEDSLPVGFQKKLSSDFPFAETRQSFEFSMSDDDGPRPTRRIVYDFSSRDRSITISLTSDFVAVTSRSYRNWDDFSNSVFAAWNAAKEVYGIGMLTRIGLRYRNIVDREGLGLGTIDWRELVRPELLGLLASDIQTAGNIDEVATSHLFRHGSDHIRLNSGLVRSNDGMRIAFLIDSDFYREDEIDGEDDGYVQCLARYNIEAGRLFRWAIRDQLRDRLESGSI